MRNEKISRAISLETRSSAPHSWRAKQRNKQAITRRVSFQGDRKASSLLFA